MTDLFPYFQGRTFVNKINVGGDKGSEIFLVIFGTNLAMEIQSVRPKKQEMRFSVSLLLTDLIGYFLCKPQTARKYNKKASTSNVYTKPFVDLTVKVKFRIDIVHSTKVS